MRTRLQKKKRFHRNPSEPNHVNLLTSVAIRLYLGTMIDTIESYLPQLA